VPEETPAPEGSEGAGEVEEPHRDDGLDLARRLAQATAGASTEPRRRRRPGGGTPPGSRGVEAASRRGARTGAHPDDRDPQMISGEVARLTGERGWALPLRMRGVFARWPELVGEEVADHCTPESFVDGRLVVRTDSTAWATQLRLLAPRVCARLNEDLGPGTVSVVHVEGPHLPGWRKGPRSVRDGRGPRDTYG